MAMSESELKTYLVYQKDGFLTLQEVENPAVELARELVGTEADNRFEEWWDIRIATRFQQDKVTDSIKEYYLNEVFGLC